MVEILLATYNGERFLPEQLESILAQSFEDFKISASDDGSSDSTFEILRSYENVLNDRMKSVSSNSHSAVENFYNLLDRADSDYICLCDQDDYWDRDKLKKNLEAVKSFEKEYGKDMPVLIHSDLEIVDENLGHIGRMRDVNGIKAFLKNAKKSEYVEELYIINEKENFSRLLAENNITGNTVIFNRALLKLYKRPKVSFMHDWWLGLIAYTFGKVGYIDSELVKYRQHENNELGAVKPTLNLKERLEAKERVRKNYNAMFAQAKEFLRLYKDEAKDSEDKIFAFKTVYAFAAMKNKNRISKIRDIFRYGFVKSSLILTIGEMLNI